MRVGLLLEDDHRADSTIDLAAPIAQAALRVCRPHHEALVVVDGPRPVGIVTRGDIIESVITSHRSPERTPIADVMTAEMITAQADLELEDALELMAEHDVHHLPVFRGEEYLGLLGLADLTCWLLIDLEARLEDPFAYITRKR